jgi:hypothetical protein
VAVERVQTILLVLLDWLVVLEAGVEAVFQILEPEAQETLQSLLRRREVMVERGTLVQLLHIFLLAVAGAGHLKLDLLHQPHLAVMVVMEPHLLFRVLL